MNHNCEMFSVFLYFVLSVLYEFEVQKSDVLKSSISKHGLLFVYLALYGTKCFVSEWYFFSSVLIYKDRPTLLLCGKCIIKKVFFYI